MMIFFIFEKNIRENADFLDLLDFPLHFLYKYKGNQANQGKLRKSVVSERNSKLKSTYLGENSIFLENNFSKRSKFLELVEKHCADLSG